MARHSLPKLQRRKTRNSSKRALEKFHFTRDVMKEKRKIEMEGEDVIK